MKTYPHSLAMPVQFTEQNDNGVERQIYHHGLTKQEYFAARAMQGMLANPDCMDFADTFAAKHSCTTEEAIAKSSVVAADALIAALSAGKEAGNVE